MSTAVRVMIVDDSSVVRRMLTAALGDDEPLVRGHAAWALGRIGKPEAVYALRMRAKVEPDEWVLQEMQQGLEEAFASSSSSSMRDSCGPSGAESR